MQATDENKFSIKVIFKGGEAGEYEMSFSYPQFMPYEVGQMIKVGAPYHDEATPFKRYPEWTIQKIYHEINAHPDVYLKNTRYHSPVVVIYCVPSK